MIPDPATKAAVSICGTKRNAPADNPAISLHLCGPLRIGSTVLTEDLLEELLAGVGDNAPTPETEVPNYNPNRTQVLGHVNGQAVYLDVDTSTCGGGGGGSMVIGSSSAGSGIEGAGGGEEIAEGGGVI